MIARSRLLSVGLTAAVTAACLAAGALNLTAADAAPAQAQTIDYACSGSTLLGLPVSADLPLDLDVLDDITVPLGGTLEPITGTLDLSGVAATVGTTVSTLLSNVSGLTFKLADASYRADLPGGSTIALPAVTVPGVPGSYDLTAPDEIVFTSLGGLLASLTCVVDGADQVVTTVLVEAAGTPTAGTPTTDTPTTGTPSTGTPTTGMPSSGTTATSSTAAPAGGSAATGTPATAANACVTTPVVKAGQRPTRLKATGKRVSWTKKPAIKLSVTSRGKRATGTVVACYGTLKIGQKALRKGRATLRTVRFYPGRYRVKLVYLGSAKARPQKRTVMLRVTR